MLAPSAWKLQIDRHSYYRKEMYAKVAHYITRARNVVEVSMVKIYHNKEQKIPSGFYRLKKQMDLTKAFALYNFHQEGYIKSLDTRINTRKERIKKFI